jgi:hypothetical protein
MMNAECRTKTTQIDPAFPAAGDALGLAEQIKTANATNRMIADPAATNAEYKQYEAQNNSQRKKHGSDHNRSGRGEHSLTY